MGDFNIMRNTRRFLTAVLVLSALQIWSSYGQLITCVPWNASRRISCNCNDNYVVFIDEAYVRKSATSSNANSCIPSGDSDCSVTSTFTEYVRTVCFNKTSCDVDFQHQAFACPGYRQPLYVYVRHRCQPVFDIDGKVHLPIAVIGGKREADLSGVHIVLTSPKYPEWTSASHIQCKLVIPARTVVRLDIMDLSHNSTLLNYQYSLNLGNSSNKREFHRGRTPTTMFWNNTQEEASSEMFFVANESLSASQYAAFFIRFYIFLSVIEYNYSYSNKPMTIMCPGTSRATAVKETPGDGKAGGDDVGGNTAGDNELEENQMGESNATVSLNEPRESQSNDYNIVAVVAGATVGALLLVLVVSIISVILGTRQKRKQKQRKPPPISTEQELRYNVHANKAGVSKMQAILENRENVSAMQQVKDLNAMIVSSSSTDFGTVDSRAPLETHIMTPDAAEDSAYDSSTEPVRSLEDLNFTTNPRRPNLQFQDNPLFFSLHKSTDGDSKPARVQSMLLEQPKYDHPYENYSVIDSKPPRPKSALAVTDRDHEYVNDFLPRRPTKRKGSGPLRRSLSHHYKRPGRHARPQRTQSFYTTRVDHVKPLPTKPTDNMYYTAQPESPKRKNPRRLQTIPSTGSDEFSAEDHANFRQQLSANNKYSFHIVGSTQSLSDAVYSYPTSIDRTPGTKDQPRGLLFFSNNSIHAMLKDKKPHHLEDIYSIPQKKKQSGFVKLSGVDATAGDHEA